MSDSEIRKRLRLGEDHYWEFKQFEFKNGKPAHLKRNDLADELIAFANAKGGNLLCGVTDDSQIQGMTKPQLRAVDDLLGEVSTDSIEPALRILRLLIVVQRLSVTMLN
ncbi:MAG: ATP-binding protein, partial [Acidiferrobacterales bacterium]|nr:ATP-binding protein [Acidiferrobacterales bacterium]